MKLSSKSRYGVRAVFDIAFHEDGRATQVKDIAERQAIPPRFLEQIFQDLKRAGIVASKRGPKGGYHLSAAASELRVGDVIRALEGPVVLADDGDEAAGDARSRAVTEAAFRDLEGLINACLDGMTFADLCQRGEQLGVRRKPPRGYVYAI